MTEIKTDSNGFNDVATTPLEEWIDFLKNEKIPEKPSAKGLKEAQEIMRYDAMTTDEKKVYDDHIDDIVVIRDNIETAKGEGRLEGRQEGLAEGEKIGIEKGKAEGEKIGMEKGEKIGIEKGEKIGIEKGKAEGAMQEKTDNVRKMKAIGLSVENIVAVTGLSAEEIERL